jgi:sugar/nucleoside kinase (ribokinase family)
MLHPEEFLRRKKEHKDADLINFFTPEEYGNLANEVLALGTKMVSLKSGHRGFYVKTDSKDTFDAMGAAKPADYDNWSERELWAQAFVVDHFGSATGSGDSAIAGFLSGFLRGLSVEESLKYATCLGLQNVRVLDAVSGAKSWEETTSMIAQDMPMIDAHIEGKGWNYSEKYKIWSGPNDPLSK